VVIREGPLSPARVHALIRDAGPKDRTP
jgi:hypothetical protein